MLAVPVAIGLPLTYIVSLCREHCSAFNPDQDCRGQPANWLAAFLSPDYCSMRPLRVTSSMCVNRAERHEWTGYYPPSPLPSTSPSSRRCRFLRFGPVLFTVCLQHGGLRWKKYDYMKLYPSARLTGEPSQCRSQLRSIQWKTVLQGCSKSHNGCRLSGGRFLNWPTSRNTISATPSLKS